jgi:hypothetical protein
MNEEYAVFIVNCLGFGGAAFLLIAYLIVSTGRLPGTSRAYQLLNIVGSVGMVVNALYYGALPSALINFVWVVIGCFTILKLSRQAFPDH